MMNSFGHRLKVQIFSSMLDDVEFLLLGNVEYV